MLLYLLRYYHGLYIKFVVLQLSVMIGVVHAVGTLLTEEKTTGSLLNVVCVIGSGFLCLQSYSP